MASRKNGSSGTIADAIKRASCTLKAERMIDLPAFRHLISMASLLLFIANDQVS